MKKHPADDMSPAEIMERLKPVWDREEAEVRALGQRMGYGRIMQLGQQLWREQLAKIGHAGGEFSTGPCVSMMVACPCTKKNNGGCDWCGGTGLVTKRVRKAQRDAANENP